MPYTYDYPHPAVSVDIAIFTIRSDELTVLLIRRAGEPFRGEWALPGGFVEIDEALEDAAARELKEETGVESGYLEQLYTFGAPERDPRERVISVAYFALIPTEGIEPEAASDAEDVGWFPVDRLPGLAFDHDQILDTALSRLREKLDYSTIAFELMPEEFTLPQLRRVYEVLSRTRIDERDFAERIHALGVIEATGRERRDGAQQPATLYRIADPGRVDDIE